MAARRTERSRPQRNDPVTLRPSRHIPWEWRDMMDARAARALAFGIGLESSSRSWRSARSEALWRSLVSLPWLFRMRGAIEPPSDVVIVAIDKRSADYLKLAIPRVAPLEACRAHPAAQGARRRRHRFRPEIRKSRSSTEDEEFAEAMRDFGRVFLVKGRDRQEKLEIGSIGPPMVDVPLQRSPEAALGAAPFPIPRVESRRVSQVGIPCRRRHIAGTRASCRRPRSLA